MCTEGASRERLSCCRMSLPRRRGQGHEGARRETTADCSWRTGRSSFRRFRSSAEPRARKNLGKKSSPTVAAAQEFLDEAESRYFDLTNKAQRASWVEENFITDDTEEITAQANQELSAFSAEMSRKAHEFDSLTLPTEMARKMLLLKLSAGFPAPADAKEQKELSEVLASLDGDYGKGRWCPSENASKCLDVTAVGKLMATSRDPEELKRAWMGWHAVGAPMRQRYVRMVELGNKGSRELGFRDAGALWRSNYDMAPEELTKETDRLWGQLRPLYESLHAYVRSEERRVGKECRSRWSPDH